MRKKRLLMSTVLVPLFAGCSGQSESPTAGESVRQTQQQLTFCWSDSICQWFVGPDSTCQGWICTEPPACTPMTCEEGLCGTGLSDGCGGTIDCGCSDGFECTATQSGEAGMCEEPAPPPEERTIRVTEQRLSADLGGVAEADGVCALSFGPQYRALIASGNKRRASLNAYAGDNQVDWVLQPNTRYINDNGQEIWTTDDSALLGVRDGQPRDLLNPICQDASCQSWGALGGFSSDWQSSGFDCQGWTSASTTDTYTPMLPSWTSPSFLSNNTTSACDVPRHLVCVEQGPPPSVTVDDTVEPSISSVDDGDISIGVSSVAAHGAQADFVHGRLVVSTGDDTALAGLLQRWNGQLIETIEHAPTPEAPVRKHHLIEVDATSADTTGLADKLEIPGLVRVSDEAGLKLLTVAVTERVDHGLAADVNWLTSPQGIANGSSSEAAAGATAPDGSAYLPDAFQWPYMSEGSNQDIGVGSAWQQLSDLDRLDSIEDSVHVVIADQGFSSTLGSSPNRELDKLRFYPDDTFDGTRNPLTCAEDGVQVQCPWHGTHVASTAIGQVDDGLGAAGPGGPVAQTTLVSGGQFTLFESLQQIDGYLSLAKKSGRPAVVNMSFTTNLPAVGTAEHQDCTPASDAGTDTCSPYAHLVQSMRSAYDAVFVAAAPNNAADVDATTQVIVTDENGNPRPRTVETAQDIPCEIPGVLCVGGLGWDSATRHPDSAYGSGSPTDSESGTVDIYGPQEVWVGADPDNAGSDAQLRSGTSFATAFVSGVAALVRAANPDLDSDAVVDSLLQTAHSDGATPPLKWVDAAAAVEHAITTRENAWLLYQTNPAAQDGRSNAYAVELQGTAPQGPVPIDNELTGTQTGHVWNPTWSPDGSKIAYRADKTTESIRGLHVVEMPGSTPSNPVKVDHSPADPTAVDIGVNGFQWSPDSRQLAYLAQDRQSTYEEVPGGASTPYTPMELFWVDLGNPSDVRRVNTALPADSVRWFEWSPDGLALAYAGTIETRTHRSLRLASLGSTGPEAPVEVSAATAQSGLPDDWHWLPDGSGLLFWEYVDGTNALQPVLARIEYGTYVDRHVLSPSAGGSPATFSGPGSFLVAEDATGVLYRADGNGDFQPELYYVDLRDDTPADAVRVDASNGRVFDFGFSRPGRQAFYLGDDVTAGVDEPFLADLTPPSAGSRISTGGDVLTSTSTGAWMQLRSAVSPDGSRLVVSTAEGQIARLLLSEISGALPVSPEQVASIDSGDSTRGSVIADLAFSSDSSRIAFWAGDCEAYWDFPTAGNDRDCDGDVRIADLSQSPPQTQILGTAKLSVTGKDPVWTRDSSGLIYWAGADPSTRTLMIRNPATQTDTRINQDGSGQPALLEPLSWRRR